MPPVQSLEVEGPGNAGEHGEIWNTGNAGGDDETWTKCCCDLLMESICEFICVFVFSFLGAAFLAWRHPTTNIGACQCVPGNCEDRSCQPDSWRPWYIGGFYLSSSVDPVTSAGDMSPLQSAIAEGLAHSNATANVTPSAISVRVLRVNNTAPDFLVVYEVDVPESYWSSHPPVDHVKYTEFDATLLTRHTTCRARACISSLQQEISEALDIPQEESVTVTGFQVRPQAPRPPPAAATAVYI